MMLGPPRSTDGSWGGISGRYLDIYPMIFTEPPGDIVVGKHGCVFTNRLVNIDKSVLVDEGVPPLQRTIVHHLHS